MLDLNTLLPAQSRLQFLDAFDIGRRGMIVGEGMHDGDLHAYLPPLR